MGETYDEVTANKERACSMLRKMKELEKNTKMHSERINKNTIVFCKQKDRINEYKKI